MELVWIRGKCIGAAAVLSLVMLSLLPGAARAQESGPTSRPDDEIVYQPPDHSRPGYRVNGEAHVGGTNDFPCLRILAPDHIGQTVRVRPAIYYFLSKNTGKKLEFTITHGSDPENVLDMTLDTKAGIQCIDLSGADLALLQGDDYKLSLTLLVDPNDRTQDVFSSCHIERIDPPYALLTELGGRADLREKAIVFAQNHLWFDALAALSQKIDAAAEDKSLREDRARLLNQEGLNEAADFDRTFEHAALNIFQALSRASEKP